MVFWVKCYFIHVGSNAAIDRDYKFSNRQIHKTRYIFMHAHTVSRVHNYMARFSPISSKTESLVVDWSFVKVEDIADEYCLNESGNPIYRDEQPRNVEYLQSGFPEAIQIQVKGICLHMGCRVLQEPFPITNTSKQHNNCLMKLSMSRKH
ncbi:hypothetical protein PRUPE_7G095300 [Prunus persica]|uniref:Uncharacterized protein n=1 Tax=Prunus persica TaxID=3760 RepID=A0A251N9A9_PRUPE|nr:hypothetical protein PRUPE_7G095300 [Prunus persica]